MEAKNVRIFFPAQHEGDTSESLWAVQHPTRPNLYRINNLPFSGKGVAYEDWVECDPATDENLPTFKRVYQASGNGLMFTMLKSAYQNIPVSGESLVAWEVLIHTLQNTLKWEGEGVVSHVCMISVPPGQEQAAEDLIQTHPLIHFVWLLKPLSADPLKEPIDLVSTSVPLRSLSEDADYDQSMDQYDAMIEAQEIASLANPDGLGQMDLDDYRARMGLPPVEGDEDFQDDDSFGDDEDAL